LRTKTDASYDDDAADLHDDDYDDDDDDDGLHYFSLISTTMWTS